MKHSRKMVLISEDEYAQMQAMVKPAENDTQPGQVQVNNTQSDQVVEKMPQPNAALEKVTQTEMMMPHFPIQNQCDFIKSTKTMQAEKKITKTNLPREELIKTNPPREKLTKTRPSKHKLIQTGLGEDKPRPRGPPGVPLRKQENKISEGLPPGWVDF